MGKGGCFGRWIEVGLLGGGKMGVMKRDVCVNGIRGRRGGGEKGGGSRDL